MSDPYWSNVVFLSGFEGGTIVDESPLAQAITLEASTAASATWAKYGTQSLNVPNSGTATVPHHASFFDGTDSFTVEGWFRFDVLNATGGQPHYLIAKSDFDVPDRGWALKYYHVAGGSSALEFEIEDATLGNLVAVFGNWTATEDTDYFIAVDFDGTTWRIYAGTAGDATCVMVGSDTTAYTQTTNTAPLSLGSLLSTGFAAYSEFNGFMDEVRVTAGVARYASDAGFPMPTAAFDRTGPVVGDTYEATATDTIGMRLFATDVKRRTASTSDTVGLADAITTYRGIIITERLRVALSQITNHEFQLTSGEDIGLNDRLLPAVPALLAEGIGVTLTQQAQQAVNIIEELELLPALAGAFLYGRSVSETIAFADSLGQFFGGEIIDQINILPVMLGSAAHGGALAETIGLTESALPRLVIRVTAPDTIALDDADAVRMLFSPTLEDGVELAAAYLSPGSSVTTWVMNTRTGGVTEYQNYAFNSFAQLGSHYIGATDEGLYELAGDDDDGTDIIAQIKSGYAQWAGTRFTLFKAAYVAMRGEGDFVLKVIDGQGTEYNYSFTALDMRTAKVRIGKGLRTRYFAFELISTGQDFDLDTLEFVPLMAERRV